MVLIFSIKFAHDRIFFSQHESLKTTPYAAFKADFYPQIGRNGH